MKLIPHISTDRFVFSAVTLLVGFVACKIVSEMSCYVQLGATLNSAHLLEDVSCTELLPMKCQNCDRLRVVRSLKWKLSVDLSWCELSACSHPSCDWLSMYHCASLLLLLSATRSVVVWDYNWSLLTYLLEESAWCWASLVQQMRL